MQWLEHARRSKKVIYWVIACRLCNLQCCSAIVNKIILIIESKRNFKIESLKHTTSYGVCLPQFLMPFKSRFTQTASSHPISIILNLFFFQWYLKIDECLIICNLSAFWSPAVGLLKIICSCVHQSTRLQLIF